jgi:hypothetical protein
MSWWPGVIGSKCHSVLVLARLSSSKFLFLEARPCRMGASGWGMEASSSVICSVVRRLYWLKAACAPYNSANSRWFVNGFTRPGYPSSSFLTSRIQSAFSSLLNPCPTPSRHPLPSLQWLKDVQTGLQRCPGISEKVHLIFFCSTIPHQTCCFSN